MEAFNFVAGNEDCCLYTYDMRKLDSASTVHKVCVCVWGGGGWAVQPPCTRCVRVVVGGAG